MLHIKRSDLAEMFKSTTSSGKLQIKVPWELSVLNPNSLN